MLKNLFVPQRFYLSSRHWSSALYALAVALLAVGLYLGFFVCPIDAVQGNSYRIIFIHVPAAWMSMLIYVVMALLSIATLAAGSRMCAIYAAALAPTGAAMAFLALWSGAFWGRPTWGAYWVWDARLTSELILFFLYLGFLALTNAIHDKRRADLAGAVIALVGVVNVPIIYFSVKWWNTLHQGASITARGSSIAPIMLTTMLVMVAAFWMYSFAVTFRRARTIVLERERRESWVLRAAKNGSL